MGTIKKTANNVQVTFTADELPHLGFYQKGPDGRVVWIDKLGTALYVAAVAKIKKILPSSYRKYKGYKLKGSITIILEFDNESEDDVQ